MGDRDAFGREKDENSLGDMGWGTGGASVPPPTAAPEPARVEASREALPGMADVDHSGIPGTHGPPPRAFPDRPTISSSTPRYRGTGPSVGRGVRRLVGIAVVLAVLGGGVSALVGAVSSTVDDFDVVVPEIPVPESPAGIDEPAESGAGSESGSGASAEEEEAAAEERAPAAPPTGLSTDSLLRPAAFGAAMRKLRTGGLGRLSNLRVAPERIDATLVTKTGRLRNVQFQPRGGFRVLSTTGPGFNSVRTMSIADINSAAPSRLARSASGRLKKPASQVNYLVYSLAFGPDGRWYVYFKGGEIFAADARGRITRRIS